MARPESIASACWRDNRDIADQCLHHPFVRGVASGTLPRDAFVTYVGQDAVFLESFARAYALGVAKAPDRQAMDAFRELLDGVFDELSLHAAYAEKWGAPLDPAPLAATSAYTDFLLRVASLEPAAHACAAMTPCMRLYAWLGQEVLPDTAADSSYRDWVETYASPEFDALAATLERLLDRLAGDGGVDRQVLGAHYRAAMTLELGFFDAVVRRS